MNKLEIAVAAVERAAEAWANAEFANAKNIGAGGPGKADAAVKAEQQFRAALSALAAIQSQPNAAAGVDSIRAAALGEAAQACKDIACLDCWSHIRAIQAQGSDAA